MDRLACASVPALPLQLLLRSHEDWRGYPVAVVKEEKPLATILWVNERAYRSRILPGMKYAAGLSLSSALRAGTVTEKEILESVGRITETLRIFTPGVEASREEPGIFWLDASGLGGLFPSLKKWGDQICEKLKREEKLSAAIAVGFTRFGTYAIARSTRGVTLFDDPESERAAAGNVALSRLAFDPSTRDALAKLGIETVGQFLSLPAGGLLQRFGPEAKRLHDLASGTLWNPLQPAPYVAPLTRHMEMDSPESDSVRLVFALKRLLHPLLDLLAERQQALQELALLLSFDRGGRAKETLRPAEPTLDVTQLLNLAHLRLEAMTFPSGVEEIALTVMGVPATREQLALYTQRPRRDLEAANRALARIRAEFGENAVVRPVLKDGHLPEASYAWEPLEKLVLEKPAPAARPTLVRRIFEKPIPLPFRDRREPDGWLLRNWQMGSVQKVTGPYEITGGWWGSGAHREYHFIETQRGDQLWVYYDKKRRRWFWQGIVE